MERQLVFVSNYINHHQIPFCNALYRALGEGFCFIQTEPMEQERVKMGWDEKAELPYVKYFYKQPDECRQWIMECKVMLFGGSDEEAYVIPRLEAGLPVIRYSERLYKTGQWKAVSPRGLLKKYQDHTRYRKAPVYLLCAGAYVPSDFHIVHAYPGKMFRWGYFPEFHSYDVEKLLDGKGWCAVDGADAAEAEKIPYLLWAARFIDWKHPELPVRMAAGLKESGCRFHMDIIGGGELEEKVLSLVKELKVEDCVSLLGFRKPEEVRCYMEKADIYLVTSDRQEGWGAVVNEAMNSGCAVVGNHMIGAVPYLIDPDRNGCIYHDNDENMLFEQLYTLCNDRSLCRKLGREAYRTIAEEWNPQTAAERFLVLLGTLGLWDENSVNGNSMNGNSMNASNVNASNVNAGNVNAGSPMFLTGPCSPAPVIGERAMRRMLDKKAAGNKQAAKEKQAVLNREDRS